MSEHILDGTPPVQVVLRRSVRARRISLRVSNLDGRVTLTMPKGVPEREALDFARDKADWIRGHLEKHQGKRQVSFGSRLPFEGRMLGLYPASGRRLALSGEALLVPGPADQVGARVQGWLKVQARERLAAASAQYAAALGVQHGRISLRDTRSRWGSCTSQGDLMYSWRLIMAPAEVLDYVAAHEVAHLREMNHSPAFWKLVGQICPDYPVLRRWLHKNGADLHSYRFAD